MRIRERRFGHRTCRRYGSHAAPSGAAKRALTTPDPGRAGFWGGRSRSPETEPPAQRATAVPADADLTAPFQLLFARNPLPMWVYDLGTLVFLEVNDAAVAHYGYTRDEFLTMRITDVADPRFDVPLLRLLPHRSVLVQPMWVKDTIVKGFVMPSTRTTLATEEAA